MHMKRMDFTPLTIIDFIAGFNFCVGLGKSVTEVCFSTAEVTVVSLTKLVTESSSN